MKTISCGGHTWPAIGQGTWFMGDDPSIRTQEIEALRTGVELGLTMIDTAEMYGSGRSELLVGEAISDIRDDVILVSKVLPSHASRAGVRKACYASLDRLGTDYLDVYLYHWRGGHPLSETIGALIDLVSEGVIGDWGVSNFDPDDMAELLQLGEVPATNQILYNPTRRGPELDLMPMHARKGIATTAYSPIEQGRLFRQRGARVLEDIANKHGVSASTVALAWDIRDGNTCAIPKSSRAAHTRENAAALTLELSNEDIAAIDKAFPAPRQPVPLEML